MLIKTIPEKIIYPNIDTFGKYILKNRNQISHRSFAYHFSKLEQDYLNRQEEDLFCKESNELADNLLKEKEPGEKVVIVGGGLTGCEIAYELYLQGKKPVIVEMKDDLIVSDKVCLANSSFLRDFFKANKVPVHLNTRLCEIKQGAVTVSEEDGKPFDIDCDDVIISVGYTPAPLAKKGRNVHIIGDANRVGSLRTVIWQAWDAVMKL